MCFHSVAEKVYDRALVRGVVGMLYYCILYIPIYLVSTYPYTLCVFVCVCETERVCVYVTLRDHRFLCF